MEPRHHRLVEIKNISCIKIVFISCFHIWNIPITLYKMVTSIFRPEPNGRHFADDIFKCIVPNKNVLISNDILLKCVAGSLISNKSAFVQVMMWRLATGHYLNQWWLWSITPCHAASILTYDLPSRAPFTNMVTFNPSIDNKSHSL